MPARHPLRKATLLAPLLFGAASGLAGGVADAGTIALKGSVSTRCTVSVDDLNATLDLAQGAANVQVASVTEKCNSLFGYTVTLSSLNGGLTSSNGTKVNYKVSYDSVSNSAINAPVTLYRGFLESLIPDTHALRVTVPANAQAAAGTYWDTIVISIAAR